MQDGILPSARPNHVPKPTSSLRRGTRSSCRTSALRRPHGQHQLSSKPSGDIGSIVLVIRREGNSLNWTCEITKLNIFHVDKRLDANITIHRRSCDIYIVRWRVGYRRWPFWSSGCCGREILAFRCVRAWPVRARRDVWSIAGGAIGLERWERRRER